MGDADADFYTVREVARVLGVSETTVWRWVEAERLPAYRVGPRRIRIKPDDLGRMVRPVRTRRSEEPKDVWADYDPEHARRAILAGAGALAGLDPAPLFEELRAEREQQSKGRPH